MILEKGQALHFPMKNVQIAIEHSVVNEKTWRVFKGLKG